MVRRPGIEPGPPAWKAGILTTELTTLLHDDLIKIVTGVGFEPTPPKRLVPKTSALDHSATQPQHWGKVHDRTRDLSVNSRALYQLSHGGMFCYQYGGLAQSVECVVSNDEAPGSKPGFSIFCC